MAACIGQVLGALVGLALAHRRGGNDYRGTGPDAGRGTETEGGRATKTVPDLGTDAKGEPSASAPLRPESSGFAAPSVPVLGVVPARLPASCDLASERPEGEIFGELAEQLVVRTEPGQVLAVCPAHLTTAHDEVADELARALSAGGRRVLIVDGRTVANRAPVAAGATPAKVASFDPASLTPTRLAQALRRAAASADLLLLATPPVSTSAGERMVASADAVLLVAGHTPDVEQHLQGARHAVAIGDARLLGVVLVRR